MMVNDNANSAAIHSSRNVKNQLHGDCAEPPVILKIRTARIPNLDRSTRSFLLLQTHTPSKAILRMSVPCARLPAANAINAHTTGKMRSGWAANSLTRNPNGPV